ncbi:tyrosine-protein phosphatase [Bacteroidota bacterium]
MHSHLLPGIDDGSKSMSQSIDMARGLKELGFKKIITTPHVVWDYYPNTAENIIKGLELLRQELKRNKVEIEIEIAAEYMVDYEFKEKISKTKLLTFGDKYLLFELSFLDPPEFFSEMTFNLQVEGYKLVFAHPERYEYFHKDFKEYENLKAKGIYFQINYGSLLGVHGRQIKKTAEKMITENIVEFIGTDLHNLQQMDSFRKLCNNKYLKLLIESEKLVNSSC